MDNKKLKLDFEMTISDVVDLNKSFAAAKCLVCYTGRNRNYSDIGKQKIIDAIPSIHNIPIVGRYDADKNDFGGHDLKVIHTDDSVDVVNATVPFGVVPESATQWFETRIVNGEEKECFFTDIILWKRQHGYDHIVESGTLSESMEINISEYLIDQDGYCIIDKFEFEALCLLGSTVEPCFENACVQMYSNEIVSDFKLQFSEMLREFKELNQSSSTTDEVDIEIVQEVNSMAEPIKEEVVEEITETESVAEESVVEEVTTESVEEVVENVQTEEVVEQTTENEFEAQETSIEEDSEIVEESIQEEVFEQTETQVENVIEEQQIQEEVIESDVVEESEVFTVEQYNKLKTEYEKLEKEFADYKEAHSFLNSDYEILKAYREAKETEERQLAENTLFANYEKTIGNTKEFKELKEKASEFSLDELKKECLCIVGMYSMTQNTKEEIQQLESLRFSLDVEAQEVEEDPYGGVFEKYLNR